MVDRLVTQHGAGTLDGAGWLAAWREAVDELTARVVEEGDAALVRAAIRSRYPSAKLAILRPDGDFAEGLKNRLLAEGIPLEQLEGSADDPTTLRRRGAALETAWDGASREATVERSRLLAAAEQVVSWKRPWRRLVMVFSAIGAVALLLASWFGGWIPAPRWFEPINTWFWSLPWL